MRHRPMAQILPRLGDLCLDVLPKLCVVPGSQLHETVERFRLRPLVQRSLGRETHAGECHAQTVSRMHLQLPGDGHPVPIVRFVCGGSSASTTSSITGSSSSMTSSHMIVLPGTANEDPGNNSRGIAARKRIDGATHTSCRTCGRTSVGIAGGFLCDGDVSKVCVREFRAVHPRPYLQRQHAWPATRSRLQIH